MGEDRGGDDWFELDVDPHVELSRPGVYLWRIGGAPSYVGKAASLSSRLGKYRNNVAKLLDGRPYRRGKPEGFRRIPIALAKARVEGVEAIFSVMEQCEPGDTLLARGRHWIGELRPPFNGPPRGPRSRCP